MAKLLWDQVGERLYETGVKNGVLYRQDEEGNYPEGVAWNGLTGVSEEPDGGDATEIYADDQKYLSIRAREDFGITITAYTYPDEFLLCDGTAEPVPGMTVAQQARKPFGFSYVTTIGNDIKYEDYGEIIHLVYGCTASPSNKDFQTINDSPEAIEFSWEVDTVPEEVPGFRPTAHVQLKSTNFKGKEAKYNAIKDILYGTDGSGNNAGTTARLPKPKELMSILST